MRRIVWVAVGAAGGILAYRRAQQAIADAKEKGVVLSAQQVGVTAASAVSSARSLASQSTSLWGQQPAPAPGAAAAKVLAASSSSNPSKETNRGVR
jgi:transposase-like protein